MKNKTGIILGFFLGFAGFLVTFKILFLPNIPPDDELAPGIVVIVAAVNGFLFAYAGNLIQDYFRKNKIGK